MADLERTYALTERDRRIIQEVVREMGAQVPTGNPRLRPHPEEPYLPNNGCYVALINPFGIPAASMIAGTGTAGTQIPGHGYGDIYEIYDNAGTGTVGPITAFRFILSTPIYNVGTSVIQGNTWVTVVRDNYGRWLIPVGIGGGSGTTLTIDHNESPVGTEAVLDFKDGAISEPGIPGITWSVIDIPGNRVQVQPTLSSPITDGARLQGVGDPGGVPTNLVVPSGVETLVLFDLKLFDDEGFAGAGPPFTTLGFPSPTVTSGRFHFGASFFWTVTTGASGTNNPFHLRLRIYRNHSVVEAEQDDYIPGIGAYSVLGGSHPGLCQSVASYQHFNANDTIAAYVFQDSGIDLIIGETPVLPEYSLYNLWCDRATAVR